MSERPEGKRVANGKRYRIKRRNSSARVTRYLVILFAAAFFLLLMAMLMQHRANKETIDDLTESMTSIHSLQNMVEVNNTLTEENAALKEELAALEDALKSKQADADSLQAQLAEAQKSLQAMDYFRRIQMFYSRGSYSSARIVSEALEEAGLAGYLPDDTHYQNSNSSVLSPAKEYAKIRQALY